IRDLTVTGVQTCALPIFQRFPPAKTFYKLAREGENMRTLLLCVSIIIAAACALAQTARRTPPAGLPPGYWPLAKSQPIIEKMQTDRKSVVEGSGVGRR